MNDRRTLVVSGEGGDEHREDGLDGGGKSEEDVQVHEHRHVGRLTAHEPRCLAGARRPRPAGSVRARQTRRLTHLHIAVTNSGCRGDDVILFACLLRDQREQAQSVVAVFIVARVRRPHIEIGRREREQRVLSLRAGSHASVRRYSPRALLRCVCVTSGAAAVATALPLFLNTPVSVQSAPRLHVRGHVQREETERDERHHEPDGAVQQHHDRVRVDDVSRSVLLRAVRVQRRDVIAAVAMVTARAVSVRLDGGDVV